MDSEGLARVLRRSYWVTILCALIIWIFWDESHALGVAFGGLWSTTNIWAIKGLFENICNSGSIFNIALFAHLKMPILYGVGALVLFTVPLSIGAGIFGFHIPFILIVAEAVVHGSDEAPSTKAS